MQRIAVVDSNNVESINDLLTQGWHIVGSPGLLSAPVPTNPIAMVAREAWKDLPPLPTYFVIVVLEKPDDPPPDARRAQWENE